MEFRNTSAINPQRPEALVEMSSNALMADDGRVASETHLMNSLSIRKSAFAPATLSTNGREGGTRDHDFWFCWVWKSRERRGQIFPPVFSRGKKFLRLLPIDEDRSLFNRSLNRV
jgi:hypothetical protein